MPNQDADENQQQTQEPETPEMPETPTPDQTAGPHPSKRFIIVDEKRVEVDDDMTIPLDPAVVATSGYKATEE